MGKPKQQTVIVVQKPPIPPDVQAMMAYLTVLHSRNFLQYYFQDLISDAPMTLKSAERKLRIAALKELGYKDYNKRKKKDNDNDDDENH